jgi:hypothetical protein
VELGNINFVALTTATKSLFAEDIVFLVLL